MCAAPNRSCTATHTSADLQDLYGVRTTTIVAAAKLQEVQFGSGPATSLIARLARQPDAVLVSAETVKDFQLTLGDPLHLRLRGRSGKLTDVTFHYAGVAREFPSAPRDSFLVANADYVAASTGDPGVDVVLIDAGGRGIATVGARVRAVAGPQATVTDLATTQRQVGSSLTAINLSGLTRVELGFALALAVGAAGLVLAETLAERRRSFAIARALGARRAQVNAFIRVEAALVVGAGLAIGAVSGWALARILVKILTGVFDPPPTSLAVPWSYLFTLAALMAVAAAAATELVSRAARRPVGETIRDL